MSAVSTMISTGEYFVCPALASAFFFSSSLSVGSLVSCFGGVSWIGALRPPGRWAVTSGAPTRKASSDETKTRRKAFARCGVAIKRPKLASPPILLSDLLGQPLAVYPKQENSSTGRHERAAGHRVAERMRRPALFARKPAGLLVARPEITTIESPQAKK